MPEHDHDLADLVVTWLSIGSFFGAVAFLVSYLTFFNWRKTPGGRAIAALIGAWIGISVTSFLFIIYGPEYIGRDVLRVLAWLFGFGAMWGLPVSLWRAWTKGFRTALIAEPRTVPGERQSETTQTPPEPTGLGGPAAERPGPQGSESA